MERKLGIFGLADFFAQRRRKKPAALDGINAMMNWGALRNCFVRNSTGRMNPKMEPATICLAHVQGAVTSGDVQKLLAEFNTQLEKDGKLIRQGVALDVSVVESIACPRKPVAIEEIADDREEPELSKPAEFKVTTTYSHDTDAAWFKQGKTSHYGYEIHATVDSRDGFVLAAHATPANMSDTGQFERLVIDAHLPKNTRVFADKGYTSKHNSDVLKKRKFKDAIMARAFRNSPLTEHDNQRNRLISTKRYIVERAFGTLKEVHGAARASYLGVLKVQAEFLLSPMAYNLKKTLFVCQA